jgi:hypothetical protein
MSRSRSGVIVRSLRNPYSVHWADPVFEDITAKLIQLGLKECKVCGSETGLQPQKLPVVLPLGGIPESRLRDSETNIAYMVQVECIVCGHSLLFNSERFITGDTPALEAAKPR